MRTLILGLGIAAAAPTPLYGQNWPGRVARWTRSGVEVLDNPRATPRLVFADTSIYGGITPSVSPDGGLVALTLKSRGVIEGNRYGVPPYPTTVIVDARSGAERLRIPGGYAFTWCGTDCIAVIYGVYSEDSEVGPYGDSAAVYDVVARGRRLVLYRERGVFYAPRWIPRDSSVIFGGFRGGPRYRVHDGTPIRWSGASPELSGSERWAVRRVEGDSRVVPSDGSADSIPVPLPGPWQIEEWIGQTDQVLVLELPPRRIVDRNDPEARRVRVPLAPRPDPNAPPPERTYRIWDLSTGRVSEEWKAAETKWRGPAPSECRLFLKEGRLTAVPGCE